MAWFGPSAAGAQPGPTGRGATAPVPSAGDSKDGIGPAAGPDAEAVRWLQRGGVVAVFRHALAPGVYDPPGMRLGDCRTQRNLNDEGRRQAAALGAWFGRHRLQPTRVLSSPWCRSMDTAHGAFGRAQAWRALGSPQGPSGADATPPDATATLRRALSDQAAATFDVWFTHNFVISALTGVSTDSAEGVVLRGRPDGAVQQLARIGVA